MKKGFTLIELLATIVILAVISLITVPLVLDTVEKSKKGALKESANSLVQEANYYYMQYGVTENVRFNIKNNDINKIDGNTLLFKGQVKDATVLINTKGEVAICANDGNYSVYKNYKDNMLIEVDNKNCNIPTNQSVVYLDNESTIKEYTNQELTELVLSLQSEIENLKNNTDLTPTGTVISYMGNNVPTGYLSCDGTVYNISDYPKLAEQIKTEFGSYNYFGGDGSTTFAVPDLRGEFLRGTGKATRNTGSGASVGVHQDGTKEPFINIGKTSSETTSHLNIYMDNDVDNVRKDADVYYKPETSLTAYQFIADKNITTTTKATTYAYSTRPTNTAVLYCIKY